jgi:hypothetical protein
MKKTTLLLLFLLSGAVYSLAQDLPNLKYVKLNKRSHFKDAESTTLKVVDYLFATPVDKKNKSRTLAGEFLIKWMNGTPDYTFHLEESETKYFNTDSDLMLMYMAGLTKFALTNPAVKDQKATVLGALAFTMSYLNQQKDKKSWSAELWQLNEAGQMGKLAAFLAQ